jgi:hypothetical protein
MFRITFETCRKFTLAEILIMAAINNLESGYDPEGRIRTKDRATKNENTSC